MNTPPNLLPIFDEGRFSYQLASEWSVGTPLGFFTVPAGLIIDGASVPRLFWSLFPPDGLYRAGTTLHDWLYCQRGEVCSCCQPFTRAEADGLLLALCREFRARGASLMHRMVRWFGGSAWKRATGPRIEPLRYQVS